MSSRRRRLARIMAGIAAAVVALSGCAGAQPDAGPAPAGAPAGSTAAAGGSSPAALAFSGTTLDGAQLDVSTLSGQPVVLWFWAPWCTICRVEAPDVAAVAAEFDGQVSFLGVPGRGPEQDMRRFVDETGTGDFAHLVDADGSLWQRFGVISQPSFVFVAADGTARSFAGSLPQEELRQVATGLAAG